MKKLILILFIIFISKITVTADDSSFYTVPCISFDYKIYDETISEYIIILDNKINIPDTPFQQVFPPLKSGQEFRIKIRAGEPDNHVVNDDEKKKNEYLADTRLLEISDPDIIALKKHFSLNDNIINDVEKFVFDHIKDKKAGIPIIKATQVLKGRAGDCTEHAVLAVSIFRMLGIPARAVVGMILSEEFNGIRNVFVYHMWAEAYYSDRWILVDATRPGRKYPNRYIAISYHHLKTEMPLDYLKAVSAMKSFSIEYIKN